MTDTDAQLRAMASSIDSLKAYLDRRDEAKSREYAHYLESDPDSKRKIAATWIYEGIMRALTGYICNFAEVTDNAGAKLPVNDFLEELETRTELEFQQLTGFEVITGASDIERHKRYLNSKGK